MRGARYLYITDYGYLAVSAAEFKQAGVRWRPKRSDIVRDKRGEILHDFLTLLARDEYMGG